MPKMLSWSDTDFTTHVSYSDFQHRICSEQIRNRYQDYVGDDGKIEVMYRYADLRNSHQIEIRFKVPAAKDNKEVSVWAFAGCPFLDWWMPMVKETERQVLIAAGSRLGEGWWQNEERWHEKNP